VTIVIIKDLPEGNWKKDKYGYVHVICASFLEGDDRDECMIKMGYPDYVVYKELEQSETAWAKVSAFLFLIPQEEEEKTNV